MMINDYHCGQVNTHSFMSFPCFCESQNLLPDQYIFPPLDAVYNDDWMFEVICEITVLNVNFLRCFINLNGGVMLRNGEILDYGNAGPLVGPYNRVFVILMDSHTFFVDEHFPLHLLNV